MGLPEDLSRLLKAEGYKINETIQDAISDFLGVVTEENAEMEDDLEDDKEDAEESDGPQAER